MVEATIVAMARLSNFRVSMLMSDRCEPTYTGSVGMSHAA
jgi:hypothetical protein